MGFTLKDVVEKMGNETENSTLDWDVVVNYAESEINKLLKNSYNDNSKGLLKDLSVDVQGFNEDLDPYTVTFALKLGAPLISFAGACVRPFCSLTIPVDGGSTKTTSKTLDIPAGGYEIVLKNLELASTSGSSTSSSLIPSNKPFTFSTQGGETAYVTIDIGTSSDLIVQLNTMNSSKNNKQLDAHKADVQQKISDYLKDKANVSSIRYQLANVDSTKPPDGYVVLNPKSFRFAAYQSTAHPESILSMFIQTADTSRGQQDDLQATWTSKWVVTYKVPPIPDSYSASIIFRSTMMHESVVTAALKAEGASADAPKFEAGKGLRYKIKTGIVVQRAAVTTNPSTTAIKVDLNDDDKTLRLLLGQQGNNDSSPTGSVTWAYGYEFDWKYTWEGTTISGAPYDCEDDEHVTIKNNLAKTSSFSGSLTDRSLKLALNIAASDWDTPKVTMKSTTWWSMIFGSEEKDGSGWAKDLLATPSLSLDMGDLDFFMTTNILMPGRKLIMVDTSTGLRIPHDYYIVGWLYPQLPSGITIPVKVKDQKGQAVTIEAVFGVPVSTTVGDGIRTTIPLTGGTITVEGTSGTVSIGSGGYKVVLEGLSRDGIASSSFSVKLYTVDANKTNAYIEAFKNDVSKAVNQYFKDRCTPHKAT